MNIILKLKLDYTGKKKESRDPLLCLIPGPRAGGLIQDGNFCSRVLPYQGRTFLGCSMVKNLLANAGHAETWVPSLSQEHPLEREMVTHL